MVWLILAVVGRVIPHPPNLTPLTSVALLFGKTLNRGQALCVTWITLLLSDILIFFLYPSTTHSILGVGSWSLFTYSAMAIIAWGGQYIPFPQSILSASLFFWLWTNFGVWGYSGLYTHDGAGFISCYVAALPFLRNAVLGDMLWFSIFCFFSRKRLVTLHLI